MRIRVGLENGNEGRSIAWALDYPGCFAYGKDGSEALLNLPRALIYYEEWIKRRAQPAWLELGDFDIRLVEAFDVYTLNDRYEPADQGFEVEAWFHDDWRSLEPLDIERGLLMLSWSRADLLESVRGMDDSRLDQTYPGERWSIRGILKHVANAENFYLDCLGLACLEKPEDPFERLQLQRAHFENVFPLLAGKELVCGRRGELWSPRKVLRRALWHERDHVAHVQRLALS